MRDHPSCLRYTLLVILMHLVTLSSFAQVPGIINYLGRVVVSGTNFDGTGQFKFALIGQSSGSILWSNGAGSIAIPVTQGLFSVLLGDTTLANMAAISASVFTNSDVRLRVWFDGGSGMEQLTPDQRIAAVGYALMAADVPDGAIGPTELAADAASLAKVSGSLMIANGGNIGVGTTNPLSRLDLGSGQGAKLRMYEDGGLDNKVGFGVDMSGGNYENSIYFGSNANGHVSMGTWDGTAFGEKMRVTSGGKVGIGTNAPVEQLDVAGAVKVGNTANSTPAAGTIRWTGTDLQVYDGSRWLSQTAPAPTGIGLVPGGTFTMGWTGLATNEHQVTLSSFYLAKCEVTYAQWYTVRQWALANGYSFQNAGREGNDGTAGAIPTGASGEPVSDINWRDCIVWCNARSEKEGLVPVYTYTNQVIRDSRDANATVCDNAVFNTGNNGYRLPTEAEFEYAARYVDGCSSTPGDYPSGAGFNYSNAPTCDAVAWYWDNSSNTTHIVGTKKPNQLGICDMDGNMREWCWDWASDYYDSGAVTNPVGPATSPWSMRVQRSSAWRSGSIGLQCARRSGNFPSSGQDSFGFRYARNAQ